jgi:ankyrin repeat protein
MNRKHLRRYALLTLCLVALSAAAQQPAGPPPSIANEPPPEPGADELNAAARKGDVAAVKALLDKGISPDAKWRYGMTALFPAAERGHMEVVKLLVERGANVNVADRFYNATPITWALGKGHMEVVMLLLERGAANSPQVLNAGVEKGHAGLVRASVGKGGLPPEALTAALLQATSANQTEIAEILKAAGAQPPFAVNAAALETYAGNYESETGLKLNFVVKDGALEGGVVGQQPPLHLFATDEVTFRTIEPTGLTLTFAKDGSELSTARGSQTTKFKKEAKP